jgi:S1-C subfamily serine protease
MTVTGVSPGGPAARARYVCQGDVIVAVDVGGEWRDASRGGGGGGGIGKGWVATQLGDHRFVDARLDAHSTSR